MRTFYTICLMGLALSSQGCQSDEIELGQVTGLVTVDGQPIESAQLEFTPTDGRMSIAQTDANGHYQLRYTSDRKGAMIGTHKVAVTTALQPVQEEGAPWTKGRKELLPAKYHSQTELTAEVKPGSNEINFELTSK